MSQADAALPSTSITNGSIHAAPTRGTVNQEKIAVGVRMILEAIGEDPDREGLHNTAQRIARMYAEVFKGLHQDPRDFLTVLFDEQHDEMVLWARPARHGASAAPAVSRRAEAAARACSPAAGR